MPKGTQPGKIVKKHEPSRDPKPGNGLVKAIPANPVAGNDVPKSPKAGNGARRAGGQANVKRSNGLVRAAAAATPTVLHKGNTHDSGLARSNGLVRPVRSHGDDYSDDSYGHDYRDDGYGRNDYGRDGYSRHDRSYVSYATGYCAPSLSGPYYRPYSYYSGPSYCGPSISIAYSSYDPWYSTRYYVPCPPTYTYFGPSRYTYCPPVYCAPAYCPPTYYDDSFSISLGFSGSSSYVGFNYGYGSARVYDPYDYGYTGCYPYRAYDRCAPRYGWWQRPVWGWSVGGCDPWSSATPVYPFETNETAGALGLIQAAAVDPEVEFDEAVYSTMRGNYQTAIDATRQAVLDAPESFAPGQTDLDRYQLQRATWALTVYRNPPRAAVEEKDAAFMVAAISALAGDHSNALDAANEARELGDDHPATLELIEQLAMQEARADWGVQTALR